MGTNTRTPQTRLANGANPRRRKVLHCDRLTDTIMLEPDFAVFPKELFQKSAAGFARLDPDEAHLMVEVAHTSRAYDKRIKAPIYARHGVQEYWIVDANKRSPGYIPAQAGTIGRRSSNGSRTKRSRRRHCLDSRSSSAPSTRDTSNNNRIVRLCL